MENERAIIRYHIQLVLRCYATACGMGREGMMLTVRCYLWID